jgi:hypothetical protein
VRKISPLIREGEQMKGVIPQGIPHGVTSLPAAEITGRQRSNAQVKTDYLSKQLGRQRASAATHIQQASSSIILGSNSGGLRSIKSQAPSVQKNPLARPGRPVGYPGRGHISNSEQALASVPKQKIDGRQLLSQPLPMPTQAKPTPVVPTPLPEPQQIQITQVIMPAPQYGAQHTTLPEPQQTVRSNQVRIKPEELAAAKMKTRAAWTEATAGRASSSTPPLVRGAGDHRLGAPIQNEMVNKRPLPQGAVFSGRINPRVDPEQLEIITMETFRPEEISRESIEQASPKNSGT